MRTKESLLKEVEELFDLNLMKIISDNEEEFEALITLPRNGPDTEVVWTLYYSHPKETWYVRVEYGESFDDYLMSSLLEAVGIIRAVAVSLLQGAINQINKSTKLL